MARARWRMSARRARSSPWTNPCAWARRLIFRSRFLSRQTHGCSTPARSCGLTRRIRAIAPRSSSRLHGPSSAIWNESRRLLRLDDFDAVHLVAARDAVDHVQPFDDLAEDGVAAIQMRLR